MTYPRATGRAVGLLLLVQLAGLIVPFILLLPMVPRDFLDAAAAHATRVELGVFLLFGNGALTIGISLLAWPRFRRSSEAMALLLLAVSVIMFSLQAVDNAHLLSMLSLSRQSLEEGGRREILVAVAAAVRSTRRWVHYSALLSIDAWIFALYGLLYRFALVPRALAAFGLVTVALHFAGIVAPFFLGYASVTALGMPMALGHVALALWLMARGFEEGRLADRAAADGAGGAGA